MRLGIRGHREVRSRVLDEGEGLIGVRDSLKRRYGGKRVFLSERDPLRPSAV
jgi:hypothetical protein